MASTAAYEDLSARTSEDFDRDKLPPGTATRGDPRCAFQIYIDTRIPRWRGLGLDICALYCRSIARKFQVMQQLDKRRESLRQETIPEGALEAVDGCFWILEQLDEDYEES